MAEKKYDNAKATKSSNKSFVPWPNANKNKKSSSSSKASASKSSSKTEQAKAVKTEKELNISIPSSNVKKKVSKELSKKTNKPLVISIVIFLVLGIVLGYFSLLYLCKNDTFEMNAYDGDVIDVYLNDDDGITEYSEIGAKCVLFGKDISNEIKVEYKYREDISFDPETVAGVDSSRAGIYYAIYTIDNPRYRSVTLIRNIIVLREED